MIQKATRFLSKTKLKPADILYIQHEGRKTSIHLTNGNKLETYVPTKYLLAALPDGAFLNINKGLVIAADAIASIENGVYTLKNGERFAGRRRAAGEHKNNRLRLENRSTPIKNKPPESITEQFSVMDKLPLPLCVIELVFNSAGHGMDLIFRYGNESMLSGGWKKTEQLLNHSFYEIFQKSSHKWMVTFADVALNGTSHSIDHYDELSGKQVTIHCFQPTEGFCACMIVEHADKKTQ